MTINFKQSMKALGIALMCGTFVACGNQNNDGKGASRVTPSEVSDTTLTSDIDSSGNMIAQATISNFEVNASETTSSGEQLSTDQILAMFPSIASRSAFLGTIDKVIKTDANTLDLYSGGALVLVLGFAEDGSTLVVKHSSNGFSADSIRHVMSASGQQAQDLSMEALHFVLSDCMSKEEPSKEEPSKEEPAKEEQEQMQAQTPSKEEPLKEEPAKVEQEQEQMQAQTQEPAKEEPAKEEVRTCAAVEAILWLQEVKQEVQTQEPAKEEPAKEEPAKVEQEQAQTQEPAKEEPAKEEPAKEEPKVEQEQAQEPAKEEPAKEEPKVEQEQAQEPAKEEPAKEEPAKEEPAKVEQEQEQVQTQEPSKVDNEQEQFQSQDQDAQAQSNGAEQGAAQAGI